MADLKNVIYDIERCICHVPDACKDCSKYGGGNAIGCMEELLTDALALLKAQEPRVMTLDEWENAPEPLDGECMCYEIKNTGLRSMLVKAFNGCKGLYGKAFRRWTSRPTEEQRGDTQWL